MIGFADCLGTDVLINDSINGILVDPATRVKNLGQAMASLMRNESQRKELGTQGRQDIARFAPEKNFARWESLLEKI